MTNFRSFPYLDFDVSFPPVDKTGDFATLNNRRFKNKTAVQLAIKYKFKFINPYHNFTRAKALGTGKIVAEVYLDIWKAFDAIIDHPILLRKLYSLGILGNLYIWIKSYLTNRSQFLM